MLWVKESQLWPQRGSPQRQSHPSGPRVCTLRGQDATGGVPRSHREAWAGSEGAAFRKDCVGVSGGSVLRAMLSYASLGSRFSFPLSHAPTSLPSFRISLPHPLHLPSLSLISSFSITFFISSNISLNTYSVWSRWALRGVRMNQGHWRSHHGGGGI